MASAPLRRSARPRTPRKGLFVAGQREGDFHAGIPSGLLTTGQVQEVMTATTAAITTRHDGRTAPAPSCLLKLRQQWQRRIVLCCVVAYFLFCAAGSGRALNVATSSLLAARSLQPPISVSTVGLLSSAYAVAYALSKPASQLLAQRAASLRTLLAVYLLGSAAAGVAAGLCTSTLGLGVAVALNGLFGGGAWPVVSHLLIAWFPPESRGTYWSLVSSAGNVGSTLGAPLQMAAVAMHYRMYNSGAAEGSAGASAGLSDDDSWRGGFVLPNLTVAVVGVAVLCFVKGSPEDVPALKGGRGSGGSGGSGGRREEGKGRYVGGNDAMETSKRTTRTARAKTGAKAGIGRKEEGRETQHVESSLPLAALMYAVSAFFVYVLRQGVGKWAVLFLSDAKGFTADEATSFIVCMELGGVVGTMITGPVSDYWGRAARPVMTLCAAFAVLAPVALLWGMQSATESTRRASGVLVGEGSLGGSEGAAASGAASGAAATSALVAAVYSLLGSWHWHTVSAAIAGFVLGVCVYGMKLLLELNAIECSGARGAALMNLFAEAGAVVAAYPVSLIIAGYGWGATFATFVGAAVCLQGTVLLTMVVQRKSSTGGGQGRVAAPQKDD